MALNRWIQGFVQRRWKTAFQQTQLNKNKRAIVSETHMPDPEYNIKYICNPANRDEISHNILIRKGIGDIDKVLELSQKPECKSSLMQELSKIPNSTDPSIIDYKDKGYVMRKCNPMKEYPYKLYEFEEISEKMRWIRTKGLGPVTGQRGYILLGDLAELEQALIHYSMNKIMHKGFKLISVPDIIPTKIIGRCGLITDQGRTLVYSLEPCYGDDLSLSGTAEMSLAARLANTEFSQEDLPLRMVAVSRCYRAETSNIAAEKSIYRVHQFTKVEMFVCCAQETSTQEFEKLVQIQEELFSALGLHFQVVDMPAHDLGAPAYRKVDIEGWMPGRGKMGELSSCSNCTDYQARRLNIIYKRKNGGVAYAHTLNGTACAIPRTLIALCETYQTESKQVYVPECLQPYLRDKTFISKQCVPSLRTNKHKVDLN